MQHLSLWIEHDCPQKDPDTSLKMILHCRWRGICMAFYWQVWNCLWLLLIVWLLMEYPFGPYLLCNYFSSLRSHLCICISTRISAYCSKELHSGMSLFLSIDGSLCVPNIYCYTFWLFTNTAQHESCKQAVCYTANFCFVNTLFNVL